MRFSFIYIFLCFAFSLNIANAETYNCYKHAQFFVNSLEDIAQEGETSVLLLDQQQQVVGVISVSPQRSEKYPHNASVVHVNKLELCSSLEVDSFYYADGAAENLLDWTSSGKDEVAITQDEGMIVMNATVENVERYATKIKVTYKGYDVFADPEEVEKLRGQTDFVEDWGLPKGRGEFYFYIPSNWLK